MENEALRVLADLAGIAGSTGIVLYVANRIHENKERSTSKGRGDKGESPTGNSVGEITGTTRMKSTSIHTRHRCGGRRS